MSTIPEESAEWYVAANFSSAVQFEGTRDEAEKHLALLDQHIKTTLLASGIKAVTTKSGVKRKVAGAEQPTGL